MPRQNNPKTRRREIHTHTRTQDETLTVGRTQTAPPGGYGPDRHRRAEEQEEEEEEEEASEGGLEGGKNSPG